MGEIITIVLPVFIVLVVGVCLGKVTKVNADDMSHTVMWVLLPALFFTSVVTADMDNSVFLGIIFLNVLLTGLYTLFSYVVCRFILHYDYKRFASITISSNITNCGIFCTPIAYYAFGADAVAITVLFGMMQNILVNSLDVFLASKGTVSVKQALMNVVKMPAIYAITIGVILKLNQIAIPKVVLNSTQLIGDAAIGMMLIALGIYIAQLDFSKVNIKLVSLISLGKFIFFPLIGIALIPLFYDWSSLAAKICLLCLFGPGPLVSIVISRLYDCDDDNIVDIGMLTTCILTVPIMGIVLSFIL